MSKYIIQHRRGTTEQWELMGENIIPLRGELVIELCSDSHHNLKIGDGEHTYNELDYIGKSIINKTDLSSDIQSVLDKVEYGWEHLVEQTIIEGQVVSAVTYSIIDNKEYDALLVLMYIPKGETLSNIETVINSKGIGKIVDALDPNYDTVIRIDAEKKYMWVADYTFYQSESEIDPDNFYNSNLNLSVTQKHIKGYCRNQYTTNITQGVSIASNNSFPKDTKTIILGRRVK